MHSIFPFQRSSILGIDINSTSIKILELSWRDGGYRIENYGQALLPEGVVMQGTIHNVNALRHCVQSVLKSAQFSAKNTALALPDEVVQYLSLQISQSIRPHELKALVQMEVARLRQVALEELSFDFRILGPTIHDRTKLDVLIIITPKTHIQIRLELLESARLKLQLIDVESYAITQAIEFTKNARSKALEPDAPIIPFQYMEVAPLLSVQPLIVETSEWLIACGLGLRASVLH